MRSRRSGGRSGLKSGLACPGTSASVGRNWLKSQGAWPKGQHPRGIGVEGEQRTHPARGLDEALGNRLADNTIWITLRTGQSWCGTTKSVLAKHPSDGGHDISDVEKYPVRPVEFEELKWAPDRQEGRFAPARDVNCVPDRLPHVNVSEIRLRSPACMPTRPADHHQLAPATRKTTRARGTRPPGATAGQPATPRR